MKSTHNKLICFLTIFLLSFSTVSAQLTIDECQQKAKANYPLIKRYDLIEKSKGYTLSNAGKGYLPQISLSARASYQSEVTQIPINIPGVEGLSKDQYAATIDVSQTIWDGGVISSQKKITNAGAEVEQQQANVDIYALKDRVNQLFFGTLLLDAQLMQNSILQDNLQKNYETIASYKANGIANQADLDAVKVEQLKAEQNKTQIKANRKAYLEMLSTMIGEAIAENTTLVKPEAENVLVSNNINRPEMQLFEAQHNLFESQKSMIKAGYMPKLNLFVQGGYGKPGLNMLDNEFSPYYMGGIRLSWNFSSLYTQKNDRLKLEVNQSNVAIQKETFLYNTNLQITQENNNIKKLSDMMKYDNDIISLRENVRKSAEAKVANGTLTVIELMREINAEDLAKQDKILHDIQLLMAIYDLKWTVDN